MAAVSLNPKQLIFVQEYLKSGNGKHAAIAAGYSERSAESQASRMLKDAKVKQYLNKREANLDRDLREIFVDDAVKAYKVLTDIMEDPAAQHKDRLVAARDLLDRAGYKPVEKIAANVDGEQKLSVTFNIPRPNKGA
jgi:phage terminase small subunit